VAGQREGSQGRWRDEAKVCVRTRVWPPKILNKEGDLQARLQKKNETSTQSRD